jgi:putative nucleotide binding protein
MRSEKEESAIVLDFLPNGYPFDTRPMHRKTPIVQAISKNNFTLLELIPKKDAKIQPNQVVYIGEGKREEIHHVAGRIPINKLTQTAKLELEFAIEILVKENEPKFVEFFNKAGPISTRRHQIELLPGIGKKHMWEIIEERKGNPFKDFDDIKKRVKLIPDPLKAVVRRIIMEINGEDKFKIFSR